MRLNVRYIVTLLMLNIALIVNSANPVSFTYDNNINKKTQGIVGDILLDLINDSLLDSLLSRTDSKFAIILSVDKNGNILSTINRSKGISDNIISEFIRLLRKNNTELYVYIETPSPRPENKYDYIDLIAKYKFPQMVYLTFPLGLCADPLFDNYLKGKELKLDKPMPSRAEIKKILNKHKNIRLKTSRDFGVTEKDYFNTNNVIYPVYNQ